MFYKILMQTFSFYCNNSELTPSYKLSTQCKSLVEILLLALTKANYYTVRVLAFKTQKTYIELTIHPDVLALGVRIGALGEMIAAAQPLIEARQRPPPMNLPSPETEMVFRDLDEFEAE